MNPYSISEVVSFICGGLKNIGTLGLGRIIDNARNVLFDRARMLVGRVNLLARQPLLVSR